MNDQNYDYLLNIILAGESCTGKSSLLRYNDKNYSDQYNQTIGVEFVSFSQQIKKMQLYDKYFRLHIWDTSGDQRFMAITKAYFRGGHGFFIFFSLIDRNSFEKVSYWKELIDNDSYGNLPYILIGNKCDLENQRVVSYNEAKEVADRLGMIYLEISIKYGFNVERALRLMLICINLYLSR